MLSNIIYLKSVLTQYLFLFVASEECPIGAVISELRFEEVRSSSNQEEADNALETVGWTPSVDDKEILLELFTSPINPIMKVVLDTENVDFIKIRFSRSGKIIYEMNVQVCILFFDLPQRVPELLNIIRSLDT